ncbi:MAG: ferritin-like domain-containing protein [Actinomycetota bacterium]
MTTSPPRRPSDADIELLAYAQQAELAARDLYHAALENGAAGDQPGSVAALAAHHDAASQAISSMIGRNAPQNRLDSLFTSFKPSFSGSSFATSAHQLENTLVATHQSLLGNLEGTEGAALVASVMIAEARHVVALAAMAGLSPASDTDAYLTVPADIVALSPES